MPYLHASLPLYKQGSLLRQTNLHRVLPSGSLSRVFQVFLNLWENTASLCAPAQVKSPPGLGTVLCPYCKVEFSVVYKGLKSAAEKHRDKLERQKALEANLRAQQVSRSCNTSWGLQAECGGHRGFCLWAMVYAKLLGQDTLPGPLHYTGYAMRQFSEPQQQHDICVHDLRAQQATLAPAQTARGVAGCKCDLFTTACQMASIASTIGATS